MIKFLFFVHLYQVFLPKTSKHVFHCRTHERGIHWKLKRNREIMISNSLEVQSLKCNEDC